MFNDEDVKKRARRDDVLYVLGLVVMVVVLTVGLSFAFDVSTSTNTEVAQTECAPTVQYKEPEPSNDFAFEETEAVCEHNWVIAEKGSTLIRIVNLASVASEGIEKVYLTRYRDMFEESTGDIYIAYDENLEDITLLYWDGVFEIEYFPAGVDNEIPRMEEYEFTLYDCENCNEFKHVSAEKLTMYKFYIPEGTYLISH